MLLSILIPTLVSRRPLFARMQAHLGAQIGRCGSEDEVQVLHLEDNREQTTGAKRNALIEMAAGRFVAFVDDDDRVSDDYVERILGVLRRQPDIDCIGIRGLITFRGRHPHEFIHSLRYNDYFSQGGIYYRPPYHLNPIRRDIASRYRFADVSYSEDIDWALRLRDDNALQEEEFVDAILYHYNSRRNYGYQWALDNTERIRHTLGLRAANRLKLRPAASGRERRPPQRIKGKLNEMNQEGR